MVWTVTLQFDTSLNGLDRHSRSLSYEKALLTEKAHTSALIFSQNNPSILIKFSMFFRLVGLLKIMLNLFRAIDNEGRGTALEDLKKKKKKSALNMCSLSDARAPISFKLGVRNTTRLFCLIPDGVNLIFIQSHRDTRKLDVLRLLCCPVA